MTWFSELVGFDEESPEQVRSNLRVDGSTLRSTVNDSTFDCGVLTTPSLGELRGAADEARQRLPGELSIRQIVADAGALHRDPTNAGATFQVASQFNLLEMVRPDVTPEEGVGIYERDQTQGPTCAIAAGAGTIHRNYFAEVNGSIGQTATNQIDCLADIGGLLGNGDERLWRMSNGYAMFSKAGAEELSEHLTSAPEGRLDELRCALRIGVHHDVEVTLARSSATVGALASAGHHVTQAYCSALPVGYNRVDPSLLEPFASLILEATYEATLAAAVMNADDGGTSTCYLTLVGGGVFGNEIGWIIEAIDRAAGRYRDTSLDVVVVSYRAPSAEVSELADRWPTH